MNFVLGALTLWQRELVRFFRQPSRVIGALGPPILFWFLIGSGLADNFQVAGRAASSANVNYLQYFFPGTVALIVLFTAIFSTISIIEDRHAGFLQSVLVAPVSRGSIVLGKIAGGTTLAFVQGLVFLVLAPTVGLSVAASSVPYLLVMLLFIAFGLTGLGFVIAWRLDSTQGFHSVMNLLLIPMWLLSGALFPVESTPGWLRAAMKINPLTYGVDALGSRLLVDGRPLYAPILPPGAALGVVFGFGLLMYLLCVASASQARS